MISCMHGTKISSSQKNHPTQDYMCAFVCVVTQKNQAALRGQRTLYLRVKNKILVYPLGAERTKD